MKQCWIIIGIWTSLVIADECDFIVTMNQYVPLSDQVKKTLNSMATIKIKENSTHTFINNRPFYAQYPQLKNAIPSIWLADLPTPLYQLQNLAKHFNNRCTIFMKDDGLTGKKRNNGRFFGGNKIRKLEFLLADALAQGAQSVMTYGCIGSNHVVATGVCAKQLGLRSVAMLMPQPINQIVKRNLLLMHENGIEMILSPDREIRNLSTISAYVKNKYAHGDMPYFIPTGGSNPLGVIGFIDAAFELKQQIEKDIMPEPDYIYLPVGSGGTIAGLMLGLRAAGLQTQVIGIMVEPDELSNPLSQRILRLMRKTNEFIGQKDASWRVYDWHETAIHLVDMSGSEYGAATPEALQAIESMRETENLLLDITYSGKAAAGMLRDLQSGNCDGKTILFWNTFCASVQEPAINSKELAPEFWHCFKEK